MPVVDGVPVVFTAPLNLLPIRATSGCLTELSSVSALAGLVRNDACFSQQVSACSSQWKCKGYRIGASVCYVYKYTAGWMLATCADLLFMSIMCIPTWLMQVELDENLGLVSSSQAVVVPLPNPPTLRFFTSRRWPALSQTFSTRGWKQWLGSCKPFSADAGCPTGMRGWPERAFSM